MIGVVSYGLGNSMAFTNAYRSLGLQAYLIEDPRDLHLYSHIVLPGVGSFDQCLQYLGSRGFISGLKDCLLDDNKFLLGVCVGMQILFDESEEGLEPGLGLIHGRVCRLESKSDGCTIRLPHMGWNTVEVVDSQGFMNSFMKRDCRFYYLHSYACFPHDYSKVSAITSYGATFPCVVQNHNVIGVQFHPEKSHQDGLALLKEFSLMK